MTWIVDSSDTQTISFSSCNEINVIIEIGGIQYSDCKDILLKKRVGDSNGTSNFVAGFDNPAGRHSGDFNLNDEVKIYADESEVPTTHIFTGIIEDIKFSGRGTREILQLSGRDYGAVLQDIQAEPRIYKNTEVGDIVESVMSQNVDESLVTANSVDTTSTVLDKITFNKVSVFDVLVQLADLSGFYFYVDEDKDLHFEQKDAVSSGYVLNNQNVMEGNFRTADHEIFNKVSVFGARQLTGAQEIFTSGITNGSTYLLDAKPHNVGVIISGTSDLILQPGGVLNINDPASENTKFLVDFNSQKVTLASGTTAGDNVYPAGSVVVINYQRSTPLIKILQDDSSVTSYGPKEKVIVDRNIKDLNEATDYAESYLEDHKDPKIEGELAIKGILNITPGQTVDVNLPYQGQNGQTYAVIEADYNFNKFNNQSCRVLTIKLNKNISDFIDIMKEQMLKLRRLESAEVDTTITNITSSEDSVGVTTSATVISKGIGSAFYFGIPNHNVLNSPSSLLGPVEGGSTVINL